MLRLHTLTREELTSLAPRLVGAILVCTSGGGVVKHTNVPRIISSVNVTVSWFIRDGKSVENWGATVRCDAEDTAKHGRLAEAVVGKHVFGHYGVEDLRDA
jgi:hypothetical protein